MKNFLVILILGFLVFAACSSPPQPQARGNPPVEDVVKNTTPNVQNYGFRYETPTAADAEDSALIFDAQGQLLNQRSSGTETATPDAGTVYEYYTQVATPTNRYRAGTSTNHNNYNSTYVKEYLHYYHSYSKFSRRS